MKSLSTAFSQKGHFKRRESFSSIAPSNEEVWVCVDTCSPLQCKGMVKVVTTVGTLYVPNSPLEGAMRLKQAPLDFSFRFL